MTHIKQSIVRNQLLKALPPDQFNLLAASLEPVAISLKQVLHEADGLIGSVYFVETGMVSILAILEAGDFQEVGIIGSEGLVGLRVVFGAETSQTQALVQMAGTALRVGTPAIRQAFSGSGPLRRLLMRYMLAFHSQVTQTAACNGRHSLDERMARWMLMAHDRAGGDRMTHEFLSMMLGVRRSGVTIAAGNLKQAGVINYRNGEMDILDRSGLEAVACECYVIVRQQFDRLLGTEGV